MAGRRSSAGQVFLRLIGKGYSRQTAMKKSGVSRTTSFRLVAQIRAKK